LRLPAASSDTRDKALEIGQHRLRSLRTEPGVTRSGDGRHKKQNTAVEERQIPDRMSRGNTDGHQQTECVEYPPNYGDDQTSDSQPVAPTSDQFFHDTPLMIHLDWTTHPNNLPRTNYARRGRLSKLIKTTLITSFAALKVNSDQKENADTQIHDADARWLHRSVTFWSSEDFRPVSGRPFARATPC
jgi:hypothetical protein